MPLLDTVKKKKEPKSCRLCPHTGVHFSFWVSSVCSQVHSIPSQPFRHRRNGDQNISVTLVGTAWEFFFFFWANCKRRGRLLFPASWKRFWWSSWFKLQSYGSTRSALDFFFFSEILPWISLYAPTGTRRLRARLSAAVCHIESDFLLFKQQR